MDKRAFFLTVEPTAAEVAAAAASRRPGPPSRAGNDGPRATAEFKARAHRLWMQAYHPEQLARDDFAAALVAKGGKAWLSDDSSKSRVYFNDLVLTRTEAVNCYYDVMTGTWHTARGGTLAPETLAAVAAAVGF